MKKPFNINRIIENYPDLISYGTAILICYALVAVAEALQEQNIILMNQNY